MSWVHGMSWDSQQVECGNPGSVKAWARMLRRKQFFFKLLCDIEMTKINSVTLVLSLSGPVLGLLYCKFRLLVTIMIIHQKQKSEHCFLICNQWLISVCFCFRSFVFFVSLFSTLSRQSWYILLEEAFLSVWSKANGENRWKRGREERGKETEIKRLQ